MSAHPAINSTISSIIPATLHVHSSTMVILILKSARLVPMIAKLAVRMGFVLLVVPKTVESWTRRYSAAFLSLASSIIKLGLVLVAQQTAALASPQLFVLLAPMPLSWILVVYA